MSDFERLTDNLRIFSRGYKAGIRRARYEALVISVVLYFIIALIWKIAA